MIRISALLSTFAGAGFIGLSFINADILWPTPILVVIMVFWSLALCFNWEWVHSPGLLLLFGTISLGFLLGGIPVLLYTGGFLSLVGWDLTDLYLRLRRANKAGKLNDLVGIHFLHLGLVLAISLGLLIIAVNLQLRIPFIWITILSLTAAAGLGKLISHLLRIK
jgi:hypothetical protein